MKEKVKKKCEILDFKGMRMLNPANMSSVVGGKTKLNCGLFRVYLCAYEINCEGKGFTYDCHGTEFTAECRKDTAFSIRPEK